MDDLKERRKSVKSRRRSLRNLQPADIGGLAVDQADSLCDTSLVSQRMYGSIWIEQSESPARVRKPRRSVSCSKTPCDLVNDMIKKNGYEKENFSPNLSPPKMVEDMPKRMSVLCSAKSSNSPQGNCSVEDGRNQENSYEEIGVPRFGHRTQDESVSEESLVRTISDLCLDVIDLQCQDEEVNQSVEDKLQLLLDSISEEEQNKISIENKSLSPDQMTTESLADVVTSFVEENHQPSVEPPSDSVHSSSKSPCDGDCKFSPPGSPVETWISNDGSLDFSGEKSSNGPSKDSPAFSSGLCQDFRHLDISNNDVGTGSDSETTVKESDLGSLNENALDPLLSSDNSSFFDNSSLDQCCSLPSDSWCFVKCYSDESSNVSALIDSSVSDGCDIWETDLSSAGSELSDSWCFSRHLNTVGHFNSTPCKTDSPLAHQVNNQCIEPVKHLIFTAEDEIMADHEITVPVSISSSDYLTMELYTGPPPEEAEQKLPAIECLSLEDSSSVSNGERRIQAQKKSQVEETGLFVTPNDNPTKDESAKTLPQKTLHKKTTRQISNSKMTKVKPSLNSALQSKERKQTDNSAKFSSRQPLMFTTMNSRSSRDLERKSAATRTKKQATANIKQPPYDEVKTSTNHNKLKSPIGAIAKGKKEPVSDMRPLNVQFSKSEKIPWNTVRSSSKQKSQPKAVSPDIIIVDSLETTPQTRTTMMVPLKSKIPAFDHVSKSAQTVSTEKRKALKESSRLLQRKTPSQEGNLKRSFPQTGQQVGSKPVPDEEDKADISGPRLELSVKKRQIKGNPVSASNQVSSVPTSAAKTKRKSLDSLATSTVTVRRLNTKTRFKSPDVTCTGNTLAGLVPAKDKTAKALSSKAEKLRRRTLVVPALEMNDVTVVDLEPLSSTSSINDCPFAEDIFVKQVTTRTKRRCQSLESASSSIENSLADADLTVLLATDSTLVSHNTTEKDYKNASKANKQCESVGLASIFPKGNLEIVVDTSPEPRGLAQGLANDMLADENIGKVARGKRKSWSMGSLIQNVRAQESQPESAALEPVTIWDGGAPAARSQPTLRRSTRRSSIELSLTSDPNRQQTSATPHSSQKVAQSAAEKADGMSINGDNDSDDDEQLREIYAKKPYVPFLPTKLETIYSPTKKRGECSVFSKRKLSRMITFQPSEARLKTRRKKAMRNWPFLIEVPDADEKLHKLLNMP